MGGPEERHHQIPRGLHGSMMGVLDPTLASMSSWTPWWIHPLWFLFDQSDNPQESSFHLISLEHIIDLICTDFIGKMDWIWLLGLGKW